MGVTGQSARSWEGALGGEPARQGQRGTPALPLLRTGGDAPHVGTSKVFVKEGLSVCPRDCEPWTLLPEPHLLMLGGGHWAHLPTRLQTSSHVSA